MLTVDVPSPALWSNDDFNGFLLSVLSGPAITGASWRSGGTMAVTSLAVTSEGLWLNFAGQRGGIATFDLSTSTSSVPDAGSSLLLLSMSLAGLKAWRRH